MASFSFFSWFAVIFIFIGLGVLFLGYRHTYVRPSAIILIFIWARIQIPAAYFSGQIYNYLPNPFEYYIYCHLIPVLILLAIFATKSLGKKQLHSFIYSSQAIEQRIYNYSKLDNTILAFVLIQFFILTYYLLNIPIKSTELYALFFDHSSYTNARQESLTLVSNLTVKYFYSWARDIIGPLAAAAIWYRLILVRFRKHLIISIILLVFIIFSISLTGSRTPPASIILIILLVTWLHNKMRFKVFNILLSIIFILSFPVLISLLRGGENISINSYITFLSGPLIGRIFETSMQTTVWYAHYVQTEGALGISGFRPLALLSGVNHINLPNVIGQIYSGSKIDSVSANSSFVFDLYAVVGNGLAVPVSIMRWLILDYFLIAFRKCSLINIPVLSVLWLKCMFFMSSAYFTNLVIHGFILLFIIAYIANSKKIRFRIRRNGLPIISSEK